MVRECFILYDANGDEVVRTQSFGMLESKLTQKMYKCGNKNPVITGIHTNFRYEPNPMDSSRDIEEKFKEYMGYM